MPILQETRFASITTPLGPNTLVLQQATVQEELGQFFRIEADLVSEDLSLDFESLIGQEVTISMQQSQGERFFHGIVCRFTEINRRTRYCSYHAVIVPQLWLLTRTADCRIFQKQTVPQILESVLGAQNIELQVSLFGTYEPREYCVQYRETDFQFVSRLMEEEGIYYFFRHEKNRHTMVLADSPGVHQPAPPPYAQIIYRPYESTEVRGDECIRDWTLEKALLPGTYAHTAYDFTTPRKNLMAKAPMGRDHAHGQMEIYDYPGLHTTAPAGEQRARVRVEEIQARYETIHANADARGLYTGFTFKLLDAPRPDQNRDYLVTSAIHTIQNDSVESNEAGASAPYHCTFTAVEKNVRFRLPRVTLKPLVYGPQTAIVVGPPGEEIYTDQYGRVKVQFHWDREGRLDENSSCWMRVSQAWAGKGWGGVCIPRIGQEVIVDFLEGDPDQPIITGRVYNGEQMPPYPLPDEKTKSTLQSRSSPGGAAANFNEIRFEDKAGEEQIFINAEYDMDLRVEHDSREFVGVNRHLIVGQDQYELVKSNKHTAVDGNRQERVRSSVFLQVGQDRHTKVQKVDTLETGQEIHLKAGMKVIIEAGVQISLVGPGGFIDIGPGGVTIQGTMVLINSGGAAGTGTPASPVDPEPPDEADDGTQTGKLN